MSSISLQEPPDRSAHRVAVLADDGVGILESALAVQAFGAANDYAQEKLYDAAVVGTVGGPVSTKTGQSDGVSLVADQPWEWADLAHTLIVPAHPGRFEPSAEMTDAILRANVRGARIVSLCLGTFLLAATGVLDGREVTTHWYWASKLAEQYPLVTVHPDRIFVEDELIASSGGGVAGLDLLLHLIGTDHGSALADEIARFLVAPVRRNGNQTQLARWDLPEKQQDLHDTLRWAEENLHVELTVTDLAEHAQMSTRTFTRRFREIVGNSPMDWLQRIRVRRAQELLQRTPWTIDRIAFASGFGSEAALRYHFTRMSSPSPSSYRRTFGAAPERHSALARS